MDLFAETVGRPGVLKTILWSLTETRWLEFTMRDRTTGAVLDLSSVGGGVTVAEFGISKSTSEDPVYILSSDGSPSAVDLTLQATGVVKFFLPPNVVSEAGRYVAEVRLTTQDIQVIVSERFQFDAEDGVLN